MCNLYQRSYPNLKVHKLVEKYKHGASHDQLICDQ